MKQIKTSMLIILAVMAACTTGELEGDELAGGEPAALQTGTSDPSGGEGTAAAAAAAEPAGALPVYPTQHPRIYLTPNRARLTAALNASATSAARFRNVVNAWLGGSDIWGFQAWNGALLGQLTGTATYCTKAVAQVEAQVVAAEIKIAAKQNPAVAGDSYLDIGEMIGDVALVYDWCFNQVTPGQRARWIAYANQAVWNVWNYSQATWGGAALPWSGWSVNNPSNNYYYSFLRATMLLGLATKGENAQADTWIAQFRDTKILGQLVPRFNADLVGGASREGTGYGVAMRRLFELYSFWGATTGEDLATKTGHTQASLLAFIHQVVPTLDKVAPTGDHARDSTAALFDYHRDYLQELVQIFPTLTASKRAVALLAGSSVTRMSSSFMAGYDFLNDTSAVSATPLDGLNTAYYGSGIGELYARSGWDKQATWVNLIAGPYTESHAHQDQGSLMIYKGGWLAYDANIASHSGLSQETTAHSLVRIDSNGTPVRQIANTISVMRALRKGSGYVYASADVTPAYNNNAKVQMVQREMVFLPPNVVVVFDRVQSSTGTTQTWQLATPVAPAISGNTATMTNAGHSLKVTRIAPSAATMSTYSFTANADFNGGYRFDQRVAGGDNRFLHVMSVDGAVSSSSAAGPTGVSLNLANGQTATVSFNSGAAGATLILDGTTIPLAAGVDVLPE